MKAIILRKEPSKTFASKSWKIVLWVRISSDRKFLLYSKFEFLQSCFRTSKEPVNKFCYRVFIFCKQVNRKHEVEEIWCVETVGNLEDLKLYVYQQQDPWQMYHLRFWEICFRNSPWENLSKKMLLGKMFPEKMSLGKLLPRKPPSYLLPSPPARVEVTSVRGATNKQMKQGTYDKLNASITRHISFVWLWRWYFPFRKTALNERNIFSIKNKLICVNDKEIGWIHYL